MSSHPTSSGLKEPKNLTGQVTVDENQEEFKGNYSFVYLGRYQNELVAVKVIQRTGNPESMKRKLKRETTVWATMEHANILPFYGFAGDAKFAPFGALISPWYTKGDASRYLGEHGETMSFNDRINLWKGVIKGVTYLHGHKPVIIHGDLKPGNILIDDSGKPRICDFGLARIFLEQGHTDLTTTSEHTGTARYLAPELVSSEQPVLPTTASDVYALACIGLEFIYGQKPYANRTNNSRGQIYVDLRKGLPPAGQRPNGEWPSGQAWPLITEMWNISPIHRPLTFTIGYMLGRIPFILPLTVIQRIVYFSATLHEPGGGEVSRREWVERCDLLRSLCLVSRACRDRTLPFLYGKIRIESRKGYDSLVRLVETLVCTEGRVNIPNPLLTAYGRLVKTVILVIELEEGEHFTTGFSLNLWSLLQMMPEMRCIVISPYPDLHYPISIHPMSTLEIRWYYLALLGEKIILQAMSLVQRLSILCGWGLPDYCASVSSYHFFPNIRAISIQGAEANVSDLVKPLGDMSGWTMPHLTSLYINCFYYAKHVKYSLLAFLRAHGHTIEDLTLLSSKTNDTLFSEVLSQCPSLRSLVISTSQFTLPSNFPGHPNLERIAIWAEEIGYENSDASYFMQIEAFRGLSLAMFPKLETAEFTWGYWSWPKGRKTRVSASFKVGTDAIVINGKPLYRKLLWPLPSALYDR